MKTLPHWASKEGVAAVCNRVSFRGPYQGLRLQATGQDAINRLRIITRQITLHDKGKQQDLMLYYDEFRQSWMG